MSLAIKGRIKTILPPESGTSRAGKAWRKQSFVLDTGAQYNPDVCFGVFGDDKMDMLAKYQPGAEVEVSFNISSREYNGKYYHNIDAWKIEPIGSSNAPSPMVKALPVSKLLLIVRKSRIERLACYFVFI